MFSFAASASSNEQIISEDRSWQVLALRMLFYRRARRSMVDSGFYAACAGLRAQSQALEVSAHNLANLNTTGFRGQQTSFQALLAHSRPTVPNVLNLATNNFGVLEGTHLDLAPGSLLDTGNPLDVGIEGSGFFAIQTPQGTRYTRNGSFRVARTGELVTATGNPVHKPLYDGVIFHRTIPEFMIQGGDPSGTSFPSKFEIDYVRVYQKK